MSKPTKIGAVIEAPPSSPLRNWVAFVWVAYVIDGLRLKLNV